jgi:hypothetical protein
MTSHWDLDHSKKGKTNNLQKLASISTMRGSQIEEETQRTLKRYQDGIAQIGSHWLVFFLRALQQQMKCLAQRARSLLSLPFGEAGENP